jgi:hypothetical protein
MRLNWHRPYPPGRGRRIVVAWEFASLAILGWTTDRLFALSPQGALLLGLALAVVWVVGSWRVMTMGVYVSDSHLRIRGLVRTRTFAWSEIEGLRLHQATHRLGGLTLNSGLTVLLDLRDERQVNTALWAQGVDFHARPELFRDVFHDLRLRHANALAAVPA